MRDLTGKEFNRFRVISRDDIDKKYFNCLCSCGTKKRVRGDHLVSNKTKSCGCLHSELSSARTGKLHESNTRHGLSNTSANNIWLGIKQRCHNPKSPAFKYYGERGIFVCERWRDSFGNFLEDMGVPDEGHTLDRIDNDGPYSPDNCQWATRKDQARNRRDNRMITYQGISRNLTDWAEITGIKRNTLDQRLCSGWAIDEVFETPVIKRRRRQSV